MEKAANKYKNPVVRYKEGDLVWFSLKNIFLKLKKLVWLYDKYKVIRIIGPYIVELDCHRPAVCRFAVKQGR